MSLMMPMRRGNFLRLQVSSKTNVMNSNSYSGFSLSALKPLFQHCMRHVGATEMHSVSIIAPSSEHTYLILINVVLWLSGAAECRFYTPRIGIIEYHITAILCSLDPSTSCE